MISYTAQTPPVGRKLAKLLTSDLDDRGGPDDIGSAGDADSHGTD
jgi:hypothetical protein